MSRFEEFDEDDWDEDESEPEFGDSEEAETISCPYCGEPVYEEAQRCPACETYLSREDAPLRRSPWFGLGLLVCLALVVGWIIGC